MGGLDEVFDGKDLGGDIKIGGVLDSENTKLMLEFLISFLGIGLGEKRLGNIVDKIVGIEEVFFAFDLFPDLVEIGVVFFDIGKDFKLMSQRKASKNIE